MNRINKSKLHARLSPLSWRVTQEAATEPPFTGRFWDNFRAGRYVCIVCGTVLFESDDKYDAGCGWPSFSQIASEGSIRTREDHSAGLNRIEVRCAQCNAHLGHVFPDGPEPSGLRYCINSAALDFRTDESQSPSDP